MSYKKVGGLHFFRFGRFGFSFFISRKKRAVPMTFPDFTIDERLNASLDARIAERNAKAAYAR